MKRPGGGFIIFFSSVSSGGQSEGTALGDNLHSWTHLGGWLRESWNT